MEDTDGIEIREYAYRFEQFQLWKESHAAWWPECIDSHVWGQFAPQAESDRYTFSGRNQPKRHFAETLVGHLFEKQGYICWTNASVFRVPGKPIHCNLHASTLRINELLKDTIGLVPQAEYERVYGNGIRLKNIDLVGYNPTTRHWIFSEVKMCGMKYRDELHPHQSAALRFLRTLIAPAYGDVFLARVVPA